MLNCSLHDSSIFTWICACCLCRVTQVCGQICAHKYLHSSACASKRTSVCTQVRAQVRARVRAGVCARQLGGPVTHLWVLGDWISPGISTLGQPLPTVCYKFEGARTVSTTLSTVSTTFSTTVSTTILMLRVLFTVLHPPPPPSTSISKNGHIRSAISSILVADTDLFLTVHISYQSDDDTLFLFATHLHYRGDFLRSRPNKKNDGKSKYHSNKSFDLWL